MSIITFQALEKMKAKTPGFFHHFVALLPQEIQEFLAEDALPSRQSTSSLAASNDGAIVSAVDVDAALADLPSRLHGVVLLSDSMVG